MVASVFINKKNVAITDILFFIDREKLNDKKSISFINQYLFNFYNY